ncbi:MAG: AAA family ATPase [Acidimicrobiales bacterium]
MSEDSVAAAPAAQGPVFGAAYRMPTRVEDLGIPPSMIEDLFCRRVLNARRTTIRAAAAEIGLSLNVATGVAEDLRGRNVLEFHGLDGRDYMIGLTDQGRQTTVDSMRESSYSDTLPVPLSLYVQTVHSQKAKLRINRDSIKEAFNDLVVSDKLLDQLGPAFLNDGAIFMYGPPGTGKTSLAERMIRIHKDAILIPRAVEMDGQVITVFDPAVHAPVPEQPAGLDPRWVLCARPIVIVGGELTLDMVDLELDEKSGTYKAPIQMQANNGILVVDDFGRQAIRPSDLLNRWIIPLSRGVDFLKLANGTKFTVPFEIKLVASTNLNPNSLGDDAFLRRLRNKVYVGAVELDAFNWILARVAQAKGLQVTAEGAERLRLQAENQLGELRPYLAVDFCELAIGICEYEGTARNLDTAMIDRVASVYFVNEEVAQERKSSAERAAELAQKAAELAASSSNANPLGFDPFAITLHQS